jgi:hypothetical protein
MADQEFIDEVDRPENVVDQQQEPTMIVVPTDHQRVEAEDAIEDARVRVVHVGGL